MSSRAAAAQLALRHQLVHQAEAQRLVRAYRFSGQHHFHRRAHADQAHAAHRAAESGMDTELHLRKAERHPLVIDGDAVAAGEGELEAAAQREAVNRRDGGAAERLEAVEHLLAGVNQAIAALGAGDAGEFLDVGAGDEAALLGRQHHDTARRRQCDPIEQRIELAQHAAGEHVGGGVRLVGQQPDDAIAVALHLPCRRGGLGILHVSPSGALRPPPSSARCCPRARGSRRRAGGDPSTARRARGNRLLRFPRSRE